MRLVHKVTGVEVKVGDDVVDFRGNSAKVVDWMQPHSPASTGRIYTSTNQTGAYPSVYDCEWVDREDR